MARLRRAAFATLFGLLLAVPCLAAEPNGSEEAERAEALFGEGNRAFAAGDYQSAFALYREAWSLKKSFDIACNLGRTEAELGFHRDAAEHLDACLRTFSVSSRSGLKDAKSRFRELFNRVRAEVGALEVRARPAGTEISVDGIEFGTAPLDRQLFVDPGSRRVRARLRGYREQSVNVEVAAGGTASVVLELVAAEPAAAVALAAPPAAVADKQAPPQQTARAVQPVPARKSGGLEPRTIVVLSGAGLTLVGLGVGVGFMLDANSANDRADELAASLANSSRSCSATDSSSDCQELRAAMDQEDQSRDIAGAMFLGSAIVSAATLGLWLALPDLRPGSGTGLRVLPAIARSGAGMSVSASY
jgi:hypothetical protein